MNKYYIFSFALLLLTTTHSFAGSHCPHLEGTFFYSDVNVGEVTNTITQIACDKLLLKTVRKSDDGDIFEIETEFMTDGVLRRTTLPAPYANYEEAYYEGDQLIIKRLSMMLRRNLLMHTQDVMTVKILESGKLYLRREFRDDESNITEVTERVMDRI